MASNPLRELAQNVATSSGARENGGHAHDGDGGRTRFSPGSVLQVTGTLLDPGSRAGCDVLVQIADRKHPVAQGRNLAEHVQAVGRLLGVGHGDERRTGRLAAVDSFGRDPKTSRVESLERLADLLVWLPQGEQALPLRGESVDERCATDPHLMARPGLQEHRLAASEGLILEPGDDRARGHRLASEEVGSAHQDPDLDPRAARSPAIAATRAAERASWMPPAKTTLNDSAATPAAIAASRTRQACSQRMKLDRGPTCPPHSRPSSTNRRDPERRYCSSRPGEGTCR